MGRTAAVSADLNLLAHGLRHIHPGYGRYRLGKTEIVNAALVDDRYRPVNPVVEIEL
jgi:hypothetical protein